MTISLGLTPSQIFTIVGNVLATSLPAGTSVLQAQDNRVPEPQATDFVVMTWIRADRLATNVDAYADAAYMASISGTVMTVTEILLGSVLAGATLFGTGVATGTIIASNGTGTGGIGTYNLSGSPQTVGSEIMASGAASAMQETEILMQLDVHGPASNANAAILTTLLRDQWAVEQFDQEATAIGLSAGVLTPLYADDPKQIPFINDQQQYETRWIVEAWLQANQTVINIPQQFASAFDVTLVEIDATYPP